MKNLLLRAVNSLSYRPCAIVLPPRADAVGGLLEKSGFYNYGGEVFRIDIELGLAVDYKPELLALFLV